jgi:hypothetical protein
MAAGEQAATFLSKRHEGLPSTAATLDSTASAFSNFSFLTLLLFFGVILSEAKDLSSILAPMRIMTKIERQFAHLKAATKATVKVGKIADGDMWA